MILAISEELRFFVEEHTNLRFRPILLVRPKSGNLRGVGKASRQRAREG